VNGVAILASCELIRKLRPMRGFLRLALAGAVLMGCTSKSSTSAGPGAVDSGTVVDAGVDGPVDMSPAAWNIPVTPPPDSMAQAERAACGYKAGALPAATQGASTPNGKTIPIDNIVVVMMENRSFDHYFQDLPNEGQPNAEVAPANTTVPGIDGTPVPFVHATSSQFCFGDTNHEWLGTHQEVDNGKMDGFATVNDGTHEMPMIGPPGFLSGARAMTYYTGADLPLMYWAAQNYAIADHYFASLPGPTWPNRMYLYAATSFGMTTNIVPPTLSTTSNTIFDYLTIRGVTWRIYATSAAGLDVLIDKAIQYSTSISTIDRFADDAASGKLPQVSFVDPELGMDSYDGNDEHPPAVMQVGENFLAGVMSTLMSSSAWPHAAMFVDYDEHGGLYDHVPPPKACPPDDLTPESDAGTYGGFDEYGVRVPMLLLSPYAKKNYVSKNVYDHTSIVRFIEARFVLPALTNRDANALAPWDMFDFTDPPNLTPPSVPNVPIDMSIINTCATLFANIPAPYNGM
jgi:phospholipase C